MKLTAILIMAVIVEAIITYLKTFMIDKKFQWQNIVAIVLGIAVALAYSLDIPSAAGVNASVPYVGNVLSGILISRGSNYVYDLFKMLLSQKKNVETIEIAGADGSEGAEI